MAVAVSRRPSIVPVIGPLSAVPTFTRAGFTATRVNSAGLIELVPANQPRFDYDPVTLALKGLLIEEARTNLLLQSEDFGTTWAKNVAADTLTLNAGVAPSGAVAADKLAGDGSLNFHSMSQLLALTNALPYSYSCFMKDAGAGFGFILMGGSNSEAVYNLVNGTVSAQTGVTASIENFGGGWYRCKFKRTAVVPNDGSIYVGPTISAATGSSTAGAAHGVLIWGAQIEQASFPSSYIPTTSAAVTRNADDGDVVDVSSFFNAAEGSIFVEVDNGVAGVVNMAAKFYRDTAADEEDRLLVYAASNFVFDVISGNVIVASLSGGAYGGGLFRMAAAYRVNDFAVSANGGAAAVDAAGALPVGINRLQFRQHSAVQYPNGHARLLAYYNERLTNAELQTLSAGGAIAKKPTLSFDFTAEDVAAWGAPFA